MTAGAPRTSLGGASPRPQGRTLTFGESFKKARFPLLAFWILSVGGLFTMVATIIGLEGGPPNDFETLLSFVFGSIFGLGCGNLLGLLRVRFWLNIVFGVVNWILLVAFATAGGAGFEVVMLGWIGFLFGFGCGHLALSHRFGLAAAWLPILCWVGSIMIYLNDYSRVVQWEQSKLSAWMPIPLFFLACLVVLLLWYMAAKETHRLALWELLGGAPWKRTLIRAVKPRVRLHPRGVAAILALSAIVFVAGAVISPYLWRTGRGDREAHHPQAQEPDEPRIDPSNYDWDGVANAIRRMIKEVEDSASSILPFVPLFLLNRPIRRLARMRHWSKPLWRVPPTQRVKNLWRLVRLGVTDDGWRPRAGTSVQDVVDQVQARAQKTGAARSSSVTEAAEIYGRVRYGLGIRPDDVPRLQKACAQAYQDARRGMTGWQRFWCWWRKDEE